MVNARALWSMVKSGLTALLKSEAAHKVAAWVTALLFDVSVNLAEKAGEAIKGWILEAAEKYPGAGTGTQKWNWVWQKVQGNLKDFVKSAGVQATEALILNILGQLTKQGAKT